MIDIQHNYHRTMASTTSKVARVPGAEISDPRRHSLIDELDSIFSDFSKLNSTQHYLLSREPGDVASVWLCSIEKLEENGKAVDRFRLATHGQ